MKIQPAMAGLEDKEKGIQAKDYKLPLETENNLWSTASEETSQQLTKTKTKQTYKTGTSVLQLHYLLPNFDNNMNELGREFIPRTSRKEHPLPTPGFDLMTERPAEPTRLLSRVCLASFC